MQQSVLSLQFAMGGQEGRWAVADFRAWKRANVENLQQV